MSYPWSDQIAAIISAAEEICDPLKGLADGTAADSGAPFIPEVLEAIAALKQDHRTAFRVQLKAGCRLTALYEATAEESGEGRKQADILIDLAQTAELFHAPDGTSYGGRKSTRLAGK